MGELVGMIVGTALLGVLILMFLALLTFMVLAGFVTIRHQLRKGNLWNRFVRDIEGRS